MKKKFKFHLIEQIIERNYDNLLTTTEAKIIGNVQRFKALKINKFVHQLNFLQEISHFKSSLFTLFRSFHTWNLCNFCIRKTAKTNSTRDEKSWHSLSTTRHKSTLNFTYIYSSNSMIYILLSMISFIHYFSIAIPVFNL